MQNNSNLVINSFTGLIKKAGQSKQLTETTVELGDIVHAVKSFKSEHYIYQSVDGKSAIYRINGDQKKRLAQDNWLPYREELLSEWAEMLADQKPRPSKSDPDKADRVKKANDLLKEIVERANQMKDLGFKPTYSWKRKAWESQPQKKQKTAVQAAQQTEATVDQGEQQ